MINILGFVSRPLNVFILNCLKNLEDESRIVLLKEFFDISFPSFEKNLGDCSIFETNLFLVEKGFYILPNKPQKDHCHFLVAFSESPIIVWYVPEKEQKNVEPQYVALESGDAILVDSKNYYWIDEEKEDFKGFLMCCDLELIKKDEIN